MALDGQIDAGANPVAFYHDGHWGFPNPFEAAAGAGGAARRCMLWDPATNRIVGSARREDAYCRGPRDQYCAAPEYQIAGAVTGSPLLLAAPEHIYASTSLPTANRDL